MARAAPTTQKAKLARDNEFLQRTLSVILGFARDVIEIREEASLLQVVARNVVGRLGFSDCVIYEVSDDGQRIVQVAAHGEKALAGSYVDGPLVLRVGDGVTGRVALTGEARLVADTSREEGYVKDLGSGRSELAVPIVLDGRVIGVIDSESPVLDYYDDVHLEIFQSVAAMVAARIKVIRLTKANEVLLGELTEENRRLEEEAESRSAEAASERYFTVAIARLVEVVGDVIAAVQEGDRPFWTQLASDAAKLIRRNDFSEQHLTKVDIGSIVDRVVRVGEGPFGRVSVSRSGSSDTSVVGDNTVVALAILSLVMTLRDAGVSAPVTIDIAATARGKVTVSLLAPASDHFVEPKDSDLPEVHVKFLKTVVEESFGSCGGAVSQANGSTAWFVLPKTRRPMHDQSVPPILGIEVN